MSELESTTSDNEKHDETSTSNDVTIEESDVDSADESISQVRRVKKRVVAFESDEDDNDDDGDGGGASDTHRSDETDDEDDNDELDRRALSPRTRMSITGIRPADLTDDSSEIDYSDDEVAQPKNVPDQNRSKSSSSENDYESAEDTVAFEGDKSPANEPTISKAYADSPAPPRYSKVFESAIKDTLSSTLNQAHGKTVCESSGDSCDLQIVDKTEELIEISSSDDEHNSYRNVEIPSVPISQLPKAPRPLVQPKISTAVSNIPSSARKTPARQMAPKKYVSLEFYNKEENKLEDLKLDLLNCEKLMAKTAKNLPDGGRQLSLRIERLRTDVQIKTNYFNSLVVEDGNVPQQFQLKQEQKKPFFDNAPPNWDELSAAVNQIQPTHTGKQGLATFNNQKALTVDRLKDLHGSLETCPDENVLADDPTGLKVALMNHQKHALAWMNWREKQKPRGGILADDMGLGKTLSMISLVLADKNSQDVEKDDASEENDSASEDEDEETKENHGWRSKGRRDYYQGNTLVVCPASLARQWESEVKTNLSLHKLTVCVHHGANRDTKPRHLRTYDMVVTTYAIVSSEKKNGGALFGIKWRRIILDEAHVIRNHKAQMSMAACALRGKYRWALTGTPVQNKEMDVYALLKFLRCSPFDDLAHWKRWIDNKSAGGQQRLSTVMKSLLLRRTKIQLQGKGELVCLPEKHTSVIEVELEKEEMNVYQKIMIYSRTLFAQFLFQRAERNTDMMYRADGNRPTFMQKNDPNGAYYKMHQKFTKLHHGGQDVKSHQILVLLLRLRQICCHPGLIDSMLEDTDANLDPDSENTQPEIDILEQLNKLAIKDKSGSTSLSNSLEDERELPPEEQVLARASAKVLQRNNPVFDLTRPSSKMNKILETLEQKIINSNDKGIIVSQWTSVLNILKTHLEVKGIKTLSLNGTVPVQSRQSIVNEFNDMNSNTQILLLSLTAGGVGLNLVGANHLLLIDLHWNPQLEAQAQDRIYRVGQKKVVNIYKFMCKDTVEERIKALQEQKLAIANGILTGVKASQGSKLTMDELKGLFDM